MLLIQDKRLLPNFHNQNTHTQTHTHTDTQTHTHTDTHTHSCKEETNNAKKYKSILSFHTFRFTDFCVRETNIAAQKSDN